MNISMDKEYTTRDGREVRIYALDGGGAYPVHGAVKDAEDHTWSPVTWTAKGRQLSDRLENPLDLIEKPAAIEVLEFWVVIYKDGSSEFYLFDPNMELGVAHIIHHPARTVPASESAQ